MTAAPLLELREITVRAGSRLILGIDHLSVNPGESLAVLGANGAGKSTLLRVAAGLRRPDEGQVLLDGAPAREADHRLICACVLQRPLLRRGSARANVELGLRFRGNRRAEARRLAGPWLDRLGIAHLADAPARLLSGGEAQRVSIARALATAPRLLVLDEAFSGLDTPSRSSLLAELREILTRTNTATLLATHDVREAAAVADRIAVLHQGRIRQLDTTDRVLSRPADEVCARLVGIGATIGS